MERPENFSDPPHCRASGALKSYENRVKRSGIVQLPRNQKKKKELKGP
jgi:hypothetical protein